MISALPSEQFAKIPTPDKISTIKVQTTGLLNHRFDEIPVLNADVALKCGVRRLHRPQIDMNHRAPAAD